MKLKYQPSIYVAREKGETPADFIARVLKDPRLLPDQRHTLEHDNRYYSPFNAKVRGVWIEQAPIPVETEGKP